MIGGLTVLRLNPNDPIDFETFVLLRDRTEFMCATTKGLRKMEKLLTSDTDVMDCETKELGIFRLMGKFN